MPPEQMPPDQLAIHVATELARLREQIADTLDDMREEIKAEMRQAYPNDDPTSHRRAHEAMIAHHERRRKLYDELLGHGLKGVVWAAMVALAAATWDYFTRSVKGE